MGDVLPRFKAAAVQAAPVFLDREASVEKACALIEEASAQGADLIVLPEVFIPGGPYWAWHLNMRQAIPFSVELFQNAVDVPGEATERIGETARKCNAYVVIGINERENKSIYNTLLFYNREGKIIGKHRKFKPTGAEKLVWGEGDGSTHRVYETEIGRIGGLICGEHTMALPGYTLAAMGEQVHVASWVGFAFADTSLTEICSRYHAIAYNTFVICSQSVVDTAVPEKLGIDSIKPGGAWTTIIEAGSGRIMAGPLQPAEEGIVYAEIDLNQAPFHYFLHETTGHYWPKQFQVRFDARSLKPMVMETEGEGDEKKGKTEDESPSYLPETDKPSTSAK
ncbi:MAG: carbon-nitrogen hydrolase family protein [Deltaproteobacteria bacterium]|nr:carbon-nitrogen hydrolase family protein [Deltaproteobacteria bacterium]MBW2018241.1 carbon-nitrogen hydrolase family protein [Deltaproteobacteria bacterium]MBW2130796.1 carbon-nitrogen hydrolase family protein [Deltaproteobacteria bacterium]MBW2305259.1 carbon-nitrogen hydrolase family protein [Deltaproteobacteria bacterium]